MNAYLVATYKVTDPQKLFEYQQAVMPTIFAYNGRVVMAGQPKSLLEGDYSDVIVVLEFPSMVDAQRWYDSEEYQKIKHLRHESTVGEFSVFMEEFQLPVAQ